MNASISQLTIFYWVVECQSFVRAAERLELSKSHVSQQVKLLETQLNLKLIERNTRQMSVTFAGEQLFEHAKKLVQDYEAACEAAASLQNKYEGLLRVTAPGAYSACVLSDALPQFLEQYPDIQVQLNTTGTLLDLISEQIDVAIRLTRSPPLDRVAKKIGTYQLSVCVAKSYERFDKITKHPTGINDHPTLVYDTEEHSRRWPFEEGEEEFRVNVKPRLACNNHEMLLEAVTKGLGIARLPSYVIESGVKSGELVVLYESFMPPAIPIYCIYAQHKTMPPRVRAFVEFCRRL